MSNEKEIVLNGDQKAALDRLMAFLRDKDARVFILKGYAGTGKTTLVRKLISFMEARNIRYGLLASTGRAAKVLGDVTGHQAQTVHSQIYRFRGFNADAKKVKDENSIEKDGLQLVINFSLGTPEPDSPDVYVVDEASMISDRMEKTVVQSKFGNGRLLSDLLSYDGNAKFIFVGDPCQLAPVTGEQCPALSPDYFRKNFDIDAQDAELRQVMRQGGDNGIVGAASEVRELWEDAPEDTLPYGSVNHWEKLPFRYVPDIELLRSVDVLTSKYLFDVRGGNYGNAVFISRSNTGCYNFSLKLRNSLGYSGHLQTGELLLVVQNNLVSGLRNGDLVIVRSVSPASEFRAGLSFREIEVEELYTGEKFRQLMIDDILYQPQPNLGIQQQGRLYSDFIIRMRKKGIADDDERFHDMMRADKYLNALRVSFGYALTCHKAQGGEWTNVYAHFPRNIMLNPTKQDYQWVYTAMTRAKEKFFVVDDIYIEGFRNGFGH